MTIKRLLTEWGEKLDKNNVLTEYPRPQMKRDSYYCLNGEWDYAITKSRELPKKYGKILVPFSPECALSGVNRTIKPDEFLHYRRRFTLPENFNKGRVLLNFGAVDMFCIVYVNGERVGANRGGYFPFSLDITSKLTRGENVLRVVVRDPTDKGYYTHSKQRFKRGGIWYTPQSGIWQTVWLESVSAEYISDIKIVPDFDNGKINVSVSACGSLRNLKATVFDVNDKKLSTKNFVTATEIEIPEFNEWTPDNPYLYKLFIECDTDKVESYFGMRKFSIEEVNGKKRFMLNNRPLFLSGLLDQGYWSDGMYTAPSDEALIFDIEKMKKMGFNMLRKHIKIEPLRWYYHCDRLGMIVLQDMPSGGAKYNPFIIQVLPFIGAKLCDQRHWLFGRGKPDSRKLYLEEYHRMINLLKNVVSIAVWVPFNEGWGQFDAERIARWTKNSDSTRLVDHASGWHDQGGGDFLSLHVYFKPLYEAKDKRAVLLSEFGGYSYKIPNHCFNTGKTFGYKIFKDNLSFERAFIELYEKQLLPRAKDNFVGAVYTQLSDVEDEVNGLLTYDRKVQKLDDETVRELNEKLKYE